MMMTMESELRRLASFAHCPSQGLVCSLGLARHGFWYDGKDDRVKCFSCKTEFKTEDDPQSRHRETVPNCEYLINTACNVPLQFLDHCNPWSSDTTTKERSHGGLTATDGTVSTAHRVGNDECEQKHEQSSQLIELYREACARAQKNGLFINVSDDTTSAEYNSFVGSGSSLSDRCNINVGTATSTSELQSRSPALQIITKEPTSTESSPIPEIEQVI